MVDSLGYMIWGLVFGIAISAPVGPVNIVCLQRSLSVNAWQGLMVGAGAAVADSFYAALAAFGLSAVHRWFMHYEVTVKILGALIMIIFAVHIWGARPSLTASDAASGLKRTIVAAFTLTLTNPGVFLGFLGLFALAGLGDFGAGTASRVVDGLCLVAGVFLGSMLWWAGLSFGANALSHKINEGWLLNFNRFFAVIIAGFALVAGLSAFF